MENTSLTIKWKHIFTLKQIQTKFYYRLIMDLSAINKYLNELLLGVQGYCNELYPEQQVLSMDQTNNIKKECDQVGFIYYSFKYYYYYKWSS